MRILTLLLFFILCGPSLAQDINFIKARDSVSLPSNGMRLRVLSPQWKSSMLHIPWQLDYAGKRSTVAILRPTLEKATFGQTHLTIYCWTRTKGRHELNLDSPYMAGEYFADRSWFLNMQPKKPAKGVISLDMSDHWSSFTPPFPADRPRQFWVQLTHKPTDRGGAYNLDAWTGSISSRMVEFKI
jgi:hypothetical protein